MKVTLTGENRFALEQDLARLTNGFIAEQGDLALERLDGEENNLEQIQAALTSLPFLAARKMVVLRAPGANKQFIEQAEVFLKALPETTDLILVEPKLDKRLSYYKLLKKQTDFREFSELDAPGLARWLVDEAKKRGGELRPADARYLVERAGTNQQALASELEKLLLFQPSIDRAAIDALTKPVVESSIFNLLDAAFGGRPEQAISLYKEQRQQGVEPPQIIAMLAWQLHVVAIVLAGAGRSPSEIAREAKLNPYVVQKSQTIARRLSLAGLRTIVSDLLKLDIRLKNSSIDADEALQHYLLSLT